MANHPQYSQACVVSRYSDKFQAKVGGAEGNEGIEKVCSQCPYKSPHVGVPYKIFCLNPSSPFFDTVIEHNKQGCDEWAYPRRFKKEYIDTDPHNPI